MVWLREKEGKSLLMPVADIVTSDKCILDLVGRDDAARRKKPDRDLQDLSPSVVVPCFE